MADQERKKERGWYKDQTRVWSLDQQFLGSEPELDKIQREELAKLKRRHPLPDENETFVTNRRKEAERKAKEEMAAEAWLMENAIAQKNTVWELLWRFIHLDMKRHGG